MPEEQPVAAADGQRPERLLRLVVVDRQSAIAQVHLQRRPLVVHVTNRLSHALLGSTRCTAALSIHFRIRRHSGTASR